MEKVLVVGAGPVGLLLAAKLANAGIHVDIIEKGKTAEKYSKALSVSPGSLKIFESCGILKSVLKKGQPVHDVDVFYNRKRTAHIDFRRLNSSFDYYLSIPQPEVENCLEDFLNDQNVSVDYGVELISLKQNDDKVQVQLHDIDSKQASHCEYDYVVGCDGARSSVRKLSNITFVGKDYPMHFVMGDVFFENDLAFDRTAYYVLDQGFMIVLPMRDGLTRLVFNKSGPLPEQRPRPTITELQGDFDRYTLHDAKIKKCIWSSSANFFNRLAETNYQNRVFLAGDAYHLFSPIGGQGMNAGLQDAVSLAHKLTYYIKGLATKNMLQSYYDERYQAIRKLLVSTDLNTDIISGVDKTPLARKVYMPAMKNRHYYRYGLAQEFSGLN